MWLSGQFGWRPLQAAAALFMFGVLARAPFFAQNPSPHDPSQGEVALPAKEGWEARLVLDNEGIGVWTVKTFQVFDQYAAPEIVALDDEGRCIVLVSYSGKWTPFPRVHDGAWLGGLAHGDIDPRITGAETYTGGKNGNLYQLVPYSHGALDARLIAHLPGKEIHTVLAGEFDPSNKCREVLLLTNPGGLYSVTPTGADGQFKTTALGDLSGRIRDAALLPPKGARKQERVVTVSRDGRLCLLELGPAGALWTVIHNENMGMGRVAHSSGKDGTVLFVTLDDGRVLRLTENADTWVSETIFAGPQGLRGIVSGKFHQDPTVETIAVFGYSGRVQLLARDSSGAWEVETIFEDLDRGHWLSVAELDGRNTTDEIIGSGYSGRVFQLSRPPGYGLPGTAIDTEVEVTSAGGPGSSVARDGVDLDLPDPSPECDLGGQDSSSDAAPEVREQSADSN